MRSLVVYLDAPDPAHRIRSADLLTRRVQRTVPYLYTERAIIALMAMTDRLRGLLRRTTYRTLIGLLAVTGMRVGEAIPLDRRTVSATGSIMFADPTPADLADALARAVSSDTPETHFSGDTGTWHESGLQFGAHMLARVKSAW